MSHFKKQNLAIFLSLALASPVGGFLQPHNAQGRVLSPNETFSSSNQVQIMHSQFREAKVDVSNEPSVQFPQTSGQKIALTGGDCFSSVETSLLTLQDASLINPAPLYGAWINLNQPASCFSLKISSSAFSGAQIKVVSNLNSPHSQVVVLKNFIIEPRRFSPAVPVEEKAIIGLYFLLFSFGFIFFGGFLKSEKVVSSRKQLSSLSIFELMTLRC